MVGASRGVRLREHTPWSLTAVDKSGTARSIRGSRPDLIEVMQSLKHHSHVRIKYESAMTIIVAR